MPKMQLKANFKGKIDKTKLNYTMQDVDNDKLDPLFPESHDKPWSGVK